MKDLNAPTKNLSGSILLSSPGLKDPNFDKTVILLSAHNKESGALGVVLNRPLNKTLSDLNIDFSTGPLAKVPVHNGGPVGDGELTLVAWQSTANEKEVKLYFGITPEQAGDLLAMQVNTRVFAFLGCSGWSAGQLENELKQQAWIVMTQFPIDDFEPSMQEEMWRNSLITLDPSFKIITDSPDDPSLN